MNRPFDNRRENHLQRLLRQDSIFAWIGLITAIVMIGMNLVIDHVLARTLPVVLAMACIIYLFARHWPTRDTLSFHAAWIPQVSLITVLVGTGLMLITAVRYGGRSTIILLGSAALGSLLLLHILLVSDQYFHRYSILAQIILLVGVVRFTAFYGTFGFIGIDVWLHAPVYAAGIVETGEISGMGETKYVGSPFYHLLLAASTMVMDVTFRNALHLSLGTIMVLSVLFVYYAAEYVTSTRMALAASLIFGLGSYPILWGIHLIPTSMAVAFFLCFLLIFTKRFTGTTSTREELLLLLLLVFIVLTHQLSSFVLLVILGAAVIGQVLYNSPLFPLQSARATELAAVHMPSRNLIGYLFFNVGFLVFVWSLTPHYGQSFLESAVVWLYEDIAVISDPQDDTGLTAPDQTISRIQQFLTYFDWLGFLLLMFGTVIGLLVSLRDKILTEFTFLQIPIIGALIGFALVPPVVGIDSFIPGRWYPFLFAWMAIAIGIGLWYLRDDLSIGVFLAIVVVFSLVYPGAMILSTTATLDQPPFPEDQVRYSYTESELIAAETIIQTTTEDQGTIFSDHPYILVLNRMDEIRFGMATIPEDNESLTHSRIIYRSYQSQGAPGLNTPAGRTIYAIEKDRVCDESYHRTYSNGDVTMCSIPGS